MSSGGLLDRGTAEILLTIGAVFFLISFFLPSKRFRIIAAITGIVLIGGGGTMAWMIQSSAAL